jgi:hypothetical protein
MPLRVMCVAQQFGGPGSYRNSHQIVNSEHWGLKHPPTVCGASAD